MGEPEKKPAASNGIVEEMSDDDPRYVYMT